MLASHESEAMVTDTGDNVKDILKISHFL